MEGIIWIIGILVIIFIGIPNTIKANKEFEAKQEKLRKETAQVLASRVVSGSPISQKEIDHYTGMDKIKEKEETKKIIKGAVVGGIIGGDAGAVVGATIAKNKIDNSKK